MNCIEALNNHLKECEPCIKKAFLIEPEQLPDDERVNFTEYDKNIHFILYCEECKVYKLLPENQNIIK